MKPIVIASLIIVFVCGAIHAAPIPVEAGVSYVAVSGVRPYAAGRNLQTNKTSSIAAPFIRFAYPINDRFVVGLGYSYYGSLKGAGVATSTDIFNEGPGAAVITPFTSTEKIHDISADLRYRWSLTNGFSLEAGPTASLLLSRATIAYRSFSDSELRLGGAVQLNYSVNENWTLFGGYRLVKPSNRTLQLVSIGASLRM